MKKLLMRVAAGSMFAAPVVALADTSTSSDGAVAGMSIIIWCCCIGLSMLIPIAISYLVYKDAVKSGVDNPMLWALIVFFTGLIGLLVYFLVAKNNKKETPSS